MRWLLLMAGLGLAALACAGCGSNDNGERLTKESLRVDLVLQSADRQGGSFATYAGQFGGAQSIDPGYPLLTPLNSPVFGQLGTISNDSPDFDLIFPAQVTLSKSGSNSDTLTPDQVKAIYGSLGADLPVNIVVRVAVSVDQAGQGGQPPPTIPVTVYYKPSK